MDGQSFSIIINEERIVTREQHNYDQIFGNGCRQNTYRWIIYMSNSGELMKAFNIKDGYGIRKILIPADITPVIISARTSDIVLNRCNELGIIEVFQGVSNKLEKLKEIADELSSAAYIGDDINDLFCMT